MWNKVDRTQDKGKVFSKILFKLSTIIIDLYWKNQDIVPMADPWGVGAVYWG